MSSVLEQVLVDFYTLGDAAKVVGVSRVTLWRWIKSGKLEVVRVGREVLIEKRLVETMRSSTSMSGNYE